MPVILLQKLRYGAAQKQALGECAPFGAIQTAPEPQKGEFVRVFDNLALVWAARRSRKILRNIKGNS